MAQRGEVLFIKGFEFSDGNVGDKLVVVMHAGAGGGPYLLVKTTSNPRRYVGLPPGCSEKRRVFVVPKGADGFREDTFIQLNELFEFDSIKMVQGHWNKNMKPLFAMAPERFNALRNCLKRLKEDIPARQFNWLFGN